MSCPPGVLPSLLPECPPGWTPTHSGTQHTLPRVRNSHPLHGLQPGGGLPMTGRLAGGAGSQHSKPYRQSPLAGATQSPPWLTRVNTR